MIWDFLKHIETNSKNFMTHTFYDERNIPGFFYANELFLSIFFFSFDDQLTNHIVLFVIIIDDFWLFIFRCDKLAVSACVNVHGAKYRNIYRYLLILFFINNDMLIKFGLKISFC